MQAIVELRANDCTLVVPKVDDCIATYVWVLSNRKTPDRRGGVQLIDASDLQGFTSRGRLGWVSKCVVPDRPRFLLTNDGLRHTLASI